METKPGKSTAFEFYRIPGQPVLGIQLADLESGEPVTASALRCYLVKVHIETPWFKIALRKGSRLLLTPTTAADLLAAGKIELLWSEILLQHRQGFEAPETSAWAPGARIIMNPSPGKPPRKPRGSSAGFRPPPGTNFAGKPPAEAGMPAPAGGKQGPKAGTAASARNGE